MRHQNGFVPDDIADGAAHAALTANRKTCYHNSIHQH